MRPNIAARIVEADERARRRMQRGNVRAFVAVARLTGESQVFELVSAAVFEADNVFDLAAEKCVVNVYQTILAAIGSAFADNAPRFGVQVTAHFCSCSWARILTIRIRCSSCI